MSLSQSVISRWKWGFHTVRGGVDPEGRRFCPQLVRGVDVRRGFRFGEGTLSCPGVVEPP